MNLDALYRDVHALALHYHWAERDLLALPRDKRRRYLDLLAQTLERSAGRDGRW